MNAFQKRFAEFLEEHLSGESRYRWIPTTIYRLGEGLYAVSGTVEGSNRREWDIFYDRTLWEAIDFDPEKIHPKLLDEAYLGVIPSSSFFFDATVHDVCKTLKKILCHMDGPGYLELSPREQRLDYTCVERLALGQI